MLQIKQALAALLVLAAMNQANADGPDRGRGPDRGDNRGPDYRRPEPHRPPPPAYRPPPPPRRPPPPHYPPPPPYRPAPPPYRPAPPPPPPYYGSEIEIPYNLHRGFSGYVELDLYNELSLYRYSGYRVLSVQVSGSSAAGGGSATLLIDGISQGQVILPTYSLVQTLYPYRLEYIGRTMNSMRLSLRGNIGIDWIVVRLQR